MNSIVNSFESLVLVDDKSTNESSFNTMTSYVRIYFYTVIDGVVISVPNLSDFAEINREYVANNK